MYMYFLFHGTNKTYLFPHNYYIVVGTDIYQNFRTAIFDSLALHGVSNMQ